MKRQSVSDRFNMALDPQYWAELNSSLSVCKKKTPALSSSKISNLEETVGSLKHRGWAQLNATYSKQAMQRLAKCVLNLEAAGWLPIYCLVYDEFWQLTRTSEIQKLLTHCLGPRYLQKEAVWTHLVHPRAGSHGWSPHVDVTEEEGALVQKNGLPRFLSVWIPLTDATLENGCMYLLPADRVAPGPIVPTMNPALLLHAAQALPMGAGTFGMWRQDLVHWGSFASDGAKEPRISLTMEFQSFAQKNPNYSLMPGNFIPSTLEERLVFICDQILNYLARWEPKRSSQELLQFARFLRTFLVPNQPNHRALTRQECRPAPL